MSTGSGRSSFCAVPWTHACTSPIGERRMCCMSQEPSIVPFFLNEDNVDITSVDVSPLPLDEYWNGEPMKAVRRKMLAGENVTECSLCANSALGADTHQKYFTDSLFPGIEAEARRATAADGSTSLEPVSFDYRFSNLCTFRCLICGPQHSSSLEAEYRGSESGKLATFWTDMKAREKMSRFQGEVLRGELLDAIREGRLREIYWAGGEPLLWREHWESMREIAALGFADDVIVRYNTNLSKLDFHGTHLFRDLLKDFGNVRILASVEAAGEVGEFLRPGLKWDVWLENLREAVAWMKLRGGRSVAIDVTLTIPGLLVFDELMDLAAELGIELLTKMVLPLEASNLLCPLALPRPVLEDLVGRLVEHSASLFGADAPLTDSLKSILTRPDFQKLGIAHAAPEDFHASKSSLNDLVRGRQTRRQDPLTLASVYSRNEGLSRWWDGP